MAGKSIAGESRDGMSTAAVTGSVGRRTWRRRGPVWMREKNSLEREREVKIWFVS